HQEKVIINLNEEDEDFINNNDIWKYMNVYPKQAEDTQSQKTVIPTCRLPSESRQDENFKNSRIKISEDLKETSRNSEIKEEKWTLPHEKYIIYPLPSRTKNDDVQPLVVQGSLIKLTELEKKITKGILQAAINGEVKTRPPVYSSAKYSLLLYNDMLDMQLYSSTIIFYEMGQIIHDLTFGMNCVRTSGKVKKLIKKINPHNIQFKVMATLRIYQYFSEYPEILEYSRLDNYFTPLVI
ncbi:1881_t:CDS:2, partial [Ambispora gerdemannii]